jgi:hypothetical protein
MSNNQKQKARRAAELARRHSLEATKVSVAPLPHLPSSPELSRQAPSGPATPPLSSAAVPTHKVSGAFRALIRRVRAIGHSIWYDKPLTLAWFFRALTLLSVGYLLFDRLYETDATISLVASDPSDPFKFPFSVNNNSHIFTFENVRWSCILLSVHAEAGSEHVNITNSTLLSRGTKISIAPGHNLNVKCDMLSPTASFLRTRTVQGFHFKDAIIEISAEYEVSILGLYNWTRNPVATKFTWITDVSNPQWVRGEFVP